MEIQNRALALVNCYFGTLPNYFPLWLQSCANNSEVVFFLITDAELPDEPPVNVHVEKTVWETLVDQINQKFPFEVSIDSPYKLTDFKPAYGYIFEEMLSSYTYWGYCDVDLIFGDLMSYVKQKMESGYDLIYRLGHLTVYRNTQKMRKLFMQTGGMFRFQKVFSDPLFYSFDEHCGLMRIAKKQGVNWYYQEDMADISCRVRRMTASRQENYPYQVFYYENGQIWRAYLKDGEVKTQNYVYIHLQKRKYRFDDCWESFYILSDRFEKKKPGIPSAEDICFYAELSDDREDTHQKKEYQCKKLLEFIRAPLKKKRIWVLQKIAEKEFRS